MYEDVFLESAYDKNAFISSLIILYEHMLKFEYIRHMQGTSWIQSIIGNYENLRDKKFKKSVIQSITKEEVEKAFEDGMKNCVDSGWLYEYDGHYEPFNKELPDKMPSKYSINNILYTQDYIKDFFKKYTATVIAYNYISNSDYCPKDFYPVKNDSLYREKSYTTDDAIKKSIIRNYPKDMNRIRKNQIKEAKKMTVEEEDELYQNMIKNCSEKLSIADYTAYLRLNKLSHIPDGDVTDVEILLWQNLYNVRAGIESNFEKLIKTMIKYKYNSKYDFDVVTNIILIMRYGNYLFDNIFIDVQYRPMTYGDSKNYIWEYVSDIFTDTNIQKIYDDLIENTVCLHGKVPKKHDIDIHELIYDTRIYLMWFLYANAPTILAQDILDLIHDIPTVVM